jgi:hypothetical protein
MKTTDVEHKGMLHHLQKVRSCVSRESASRLSIDDERALRLRYCKQLNNA